MVWLNLKYLLRESKTLCTYGESSEQLVADSLLLWLSGLYVSCRKILGLISFFQQVLVFGESSPLGLEIVLGLELGLGLGQS